MRDVIEKIAKEAIQMQLITGTVVEVYEDAHTCDVEPWNGDAEIFDVKLRVLIDNEESGVIKYPAVGATVLVGLASSTDAYLLGASALQKLVVKMEGFRLEVDSAGNATFNGGANGGMVKLPELQAQIAKNTLFLETIRATFASWVVVPADGGAALKAAMSAALGSLQTADLSNAGNDKITH